MSRTSQPRSIWNGTISLGRIPVPVKVFAAVGEHNIPFHQGHATNGENVVLSKEEIAAAGDRARVIDLEAFVVAGDIAPDFYDRTDDIRAQNDKARGLYCLLHDALARTARAGIGRWLFRNREYLVAIRAVDGVLALHTMRFPDERIDPGTVMAPGGARGPGTREIDVASRLGVLGRPRSFHPDAIAAAMKR